LLRRIERDGIDHHFSPEIYVGDQLGSFNIIMRLITGIWGMGFALSLVQQGMKENAELSS